MTDKKRPARPGDGRDAPRGGARRATAGTGESLINTDKLGREQQRRATAYGRARGQL